MPAAIPAALSEVAAYFSEWEDRAEFPPGPQLAIALSGGLSGLSDIELAETVAAARRQTSWAQALELTAIAELSARRTAAAKAEQGWWGSQTHRLITGEVSLALTLTPSAASALADLADQLTGQLPDTLAALRAGHIDKDRARIIAEGVRGLTDDIVHLVEDTVLPQAPTLTTGQLRAKIAKIIQLIDPDGYQERRRNARAGRRVEIYDNPVGTTDLAIRDLATEVAHAIYNRLTAAATALKTDGDTRPLDAIRADLTCDLLRGTPLPDAVRTILTTSQTHTSNNPAQPPHTPTVSDNAADETPNPNPDTRPQQAPQAHTSDDDGSEDARQNLDNHPSSRDERPQQTRHGPTASDNTTDAAPSLGDRSGAHDTRLQQAPHARTADDDGAEDAGYRLAAQTGQAEHAGQGGQAEHAGQGGVGRRFDRTRFANDDARSRDQTGQSRAAGHDLGRDEQICAGIARAVDEQLGAVLTQARANGELELVAGRLNRTAQSMAQALGRLKGPWCAASSGSAPGHGHPGYRPPAAMRRVVEERHSACVFPSCNRGSEHCDIDHTRPYDQNGLTCVCNLAPLCRSHHQLKQHPRWRLLQLWPGLLLWITPSGQWHLVLPNPRM